MFVSHLHVLHPWGVILHSLMTLVIRQHFICIVMIFHKKYKWTPQLTLSYFSIESWQYTPYLHTVGRLMWWNVKISAIDTASWGWHCWCNSSRWLSNACVIQWPSFMSVASKEGTDWVEASLASLESEPERWGNASYERVWVTLWFKSFESVRFQL